MLERHEWAGRYCSLATRAADSCIAGDHSQVQLNFLGAVLVLSRQKLLAALVITLAIEVQQRIAAALRRPVKVGVSRSSTHSQYFSPPNK